MDLSKLSDSDLQALKSNNVQALSDEGLVFLRQATAPPLTEEEREARQGFGSAFGAGFGQFVTSGLRGAGELLDSETLTEAARRRALQEQVDPSFIPTTEEDVARGFEEGLLPGAGAAFSQYISEPAGEMVGSFVAPTAIGLATLPVAGKLGLGALGTFALTGAATALAEFPSALGDTIERMEQEGQPVDMERATAFAIPQAVLYGFGLPGVGVLPRAAQRAFGVQSEELVKRVLAGELTKKEATEQLSSTLANIAKETALASGSGAAIVTGAEALKRQAAGQELSDEEAVDEYMSQALAAGALGPLFGLPIGGMRRRGERKRVEAAGATREAEVAAEQKTAEEAAAQQAELAKRGMLFAPEEMGGERVGPPEARDIPEVEAASAFNRFELTQKEQTLNDRLDDLRERIDTAAETQDFGTVEGLTRQAKTIQEELKTTRTQLKEAGGAAKSVVELEKQFNSQRKALQKAAAEGDTDKVAALVPKVRATEQELAQTREALQPDDLFAAADRREAEGRARVDEELAGQTEEFQTLVARSQDASDDTVRQLDEDMEALPEILQKASDENLIERLDEILERVSQNNALKLAKTVDVDAQRKALANQQKIERLKRTMQEAVESGDLRPIPRLRNRLAELISESGAGRPDVARSKALEDQAGLVETVRSAVETIKRGEFVGGRAGGEEVLPRQEYYRQAAQAVSGYADAAVREVNALRRQNNQKPLTNTEAIRLAMDVRGHLEKSLTNLNEPAFRLGKGAISPIEKQLAQIKKKYHRGAPARRRVAKEQPEGFRLEGERDVVSPVLRARDETVLPVTPEERAAATAEIANIEKRLGNISKELTKVYQTQLGTSPTTVVDLKKARRLEGEAEKLEQRYRSIQKRLGQQARVQRPEVIGVRERALERVEAEARPAEEARLSELERTDPQELQARLDTERAKDVPDARAIRELEEALKVSTERQRSVEQMGVPGEGRQMQLFGGQDLKPIATTRATPENFMRLLRSDKVQKLRKQKENIQDALAGARKDSLTLNRQSAESLRGRLQEVERALRVFEKDVNQVWQIPSTLAKNVDAAKAEVKRIEQQIKTVDAEQNKILARQQRASKDDSPEATTVRTQLGNEFNAARQQREDLTTALKNAKKATADAVKQQKKLSSVRPSQLKEIDSFQGTLANLRAEKLALEKKLADKQDAFLTDLKKQNASPEQVKAATDAAAATRAQIGQTEAAIRNQREEVSRTKSLAEQTRLEAEEAAPKKVVRTGEVRLDKERQDELESLRNELATEQAKDKPNQRKIATLQNKIKKLVLKPIETAKARVTETPGFKTREDIDAEQRSRQAEMVAELADKNLPISTYGVIRNLKNAEVKRQKLLKDLEAKKKKIAAAERELGARKTDKGKATAQAGLNKARAERDAVEAALRDTNKEIDSFTKTYDQMVKDVEQARREAGKFAVSDLRPSLERLEKNGVKLREDAAATKKDIAAKLEVVKAAKGKDEKSNLQKKLEDAQDKLRQLESSLKINEQAIELKKRQIDRVENLLARKGDEPFRKERREPLRGAGGRTETARDRLADLDNFMESAGLNWKTIDDYNEGGIALRVLAPTNNRIDPTEAASVGSRLDAAIPDGIKFKSVADFSDLPQDVKKELFDTLGVTEGIEAARNIRGFVLPNGDVYIIRNNHISRADLEATYVHELVGHVSADRLLGSEGINKLSKRIEAMPGGAYGIARELGIEQNLRGAMADMALTIKKMSDEGKPKADIDRAMKNMEIAAARELLAYTAEKRVTENLRQKLGRWYKEIIGVFRDWMRRSGMAELPKVSDADIYNIIRKAQRNYNKNQVGAFRKIEGDVAFRKSASTPNPALDSGIVGTVGKVVPKEQTLGDRIKATASGMQFMHRFVDRFAGLDYIARTAFKDSLEGTQMMYYNRIADQRSNMVANVATSGPVRLVKNEKDGTFQYKSAGKPSLKQIFESLKGAQKDFGNERFTVDTFGTYLAVERAAADKGGLAAGLKKLDLSGKISTAEAQKLLMAGRASEAFQKARQQYRQYNDGLIDLLVDTGRISKEQAKDYKRADYVPYYREREGEIWDVEHNIRVGDIKNQPYLRQLVGGDSAIVNFEVGALQNTYMLTEMALGNVATKNTAFTLQTLGVADVAKGKGTAGPSVIRFYKDGEEHHARINTRGNALKYEEQLAEMRAKGKANTEQYKKLSALADKAKTSETLFGNIPAELIVKGMDGISLELPLAIKFMQGPANLLRKAVTRNPAYAARIALKDSLYGWVASGADVKPVVGVLGNLKGAWTGEQPAIKKLQEQGIIGGHVFNGTVDDMRTVALQLSRGQKGWEKLMGKADRLAILADEAARVTLYDGFIKKGMTEMEATLATLEAQNFTKHGFSPSVRYMSTMIPFFNAQIQGLNVFARALAGKSLFEDKLGVQTAALQRGGLLAGGTMLYATLMQDNEAYKNATQEDRLNYWFVPVPFFDEPVRVPIPFEAGLVFKALPEGIVNMAMEDDRSSDVLNALGKLTLAAIPGSSNLFLPQGAKPLIEIATNTSFFGMRPIEGLRAQQVESGYRYGARTTEVSKAVGELTGISPLKIDHFVNGYTSGLGIALLSAFNPVLRDTDPATLKTSEFSIVGGFFQPTDGTGVINKMYNDMQAIQEVGNTFKRLADEDPKKAQAYLNKYAKEIEQLSLAGAFRQEMGELNSAERAVRSDGQMSPEKRRKFLDDIRKAKIELAGLYREALNK